MIGSFVFGASIFLMFDSMYYVAFDVLIKKNSEGLSSSEPNNTMWKLEREDKDFKEIKKGLFPLYNKVETLHKIAIYMCVCVYFYLCDLKEEAYIWGIVGVYLVPAQQGIVG